MIPGEVLLGDGAGRAVRRRGRSIDACTVAQHRRPARPGRLALPLRRGQPGAVVRPGRGPRPPAGHPGRHVGALRARHRAHGRRWCRSAARRVVAGLPRRGRPARSTRSALMELDRDRYAAAVRPDHRRPHPPGRHRPADRGRARTAAGGGDEAVFGGGKVIRESMGQSAATRAEGTPDLVITGAVILDHWGVVKADVGVRDGRIVGHRQGRQPRHHGRRRPGAGHRPVDRDPRRQRQDPHRRRRRQPRPPDLPRSILDEALGAGITTIIGGGTGPAEGTKATTVTPGRLEPGARCCGRSTAGRSTSPCWARATPCPQEGLREQLRRRRLGLQAARGLGHDARRPSTPACGCATSRACRWRSTPTRSTRPATSSRRWPPSPAGRSTRTTPRARAAATPPTSSPWLASPTCCRRRPTRPGPHTVNTRRRAPRHAHGLPPPQPDDPRGPGLRREPHPPVDHRRRGRPPRPGRHLDDRLGLPGHGPHRRGGAAHLADRPRDEAAPGRAARRRRRPTTTGPGATSPSTRSARPSPTASTPRSARSRWASWPTSCCGTRPSSACGPHVVLKGGFIAWAQMGDANASIPTPAAGAAPPDVRRRAAGGGGHQRDLRGARWPSTARRPRRAPRPRPAARCRWPTPAG